jgi:hypothetical protein
MKTENRQAFETKKCPRCGKPLHFRYVLIDGGCTSQEDFELFDLAGHSFSYNVKRDFLVATSNGAPRWSIK